MPPAAAFCATSRPCPCHAFWPLPLGVIADIMPSAASVPLGVRAGALPSTASGLPAAGAEGASTAVTEAFVSSGFDTVTRLASVRARVSGGVASRSAVAPAGSKGADFFDEDDAAPPGPEGSAPNDNTAAQSTAWVVLRWAEPLQSRKAFYVQLPVMRAVAKLRANGVPVMRFHSGRAREFLSPKLTEWLARHHIYETKSAPEDHASNEWRSEKSRKRLAVPFGCRPRVSVLAPSRSSGRGANAASGNDCSCVSCKTPSSFGTPIQTRLEPLLGSWWVQRRKLLAHTWYCCRISNCISVLPYILQVWSAGVRTCQGFPQKCGLLWFPPKCGLLWFPSKCGLLWFQSKCGLFQ